MISLAHELESITDYSRKKIRTWGNENKPHAVVISLLRKGLFFSKQSFPKDIYPSVAGFSRSKELKRTIISLVDLVNRSYSAKMPLAGCAFKDAFQNGIASKALENVFKNRGWSKLVWHEKFVEHSSFRSAVGMAVVVYAIYIKHSMDNGDFHTAVTQLADAYALLIMDFEKKISIKNKIVRGQIEEMPTLILSQKGKKAVERKLQKDPKQKEKRFIKECWQDWKQGKTSYPSKASFARDMIGKCDHLTSNKKIEDWCREWETITEPAQ